MAIASVYGDLLRVPADPPSDADQRRRPGHPDHCRRHRAGGARRDRLAGRRRRRRRGVRPGRLCRPSGAGAGPRPAGHAARARRLWPGARRCVVRSGACSLGRYRPGAGRACAAVRALAAARLPGHARRVGALRSSRRPGRPRSAWQRSRRSWRCSAGRCCWRWSSPPARLAQQSPCWASLPLWAPWGSHCPSLHLRRATQMATTRVAASRAPCWRWSRSPSLLGSALGAVQVSVAAVATEHTQPALAGILIAVMSVGGLAGGLAYGARSLGLGCVRRPGCALILLTAASAVLALVGSVPAVAALLFAVGLGLNPAITSITLQVAIWAAGRRGSAGCRQAPARARRWERRWRATPPSAPAIPGPGFAVAAASCAVGLPLAWITPRR